MEATNSLIMTDDMAFQKICDFQGIELGYVGQSHWAVRKPHVLVELTPAVRRNTLSWLPLLEGNYTSFKTSVQAGLEHTGLADDAVGFPLHDLLVTALGSHDDHWAQMGLAWAQEAQQSEVLREQLAALMVDKRVSQATRHAAKKLLFTSSAKTL